MLTRLKKGECKGSVVRFLFESGLINKDRVVLDLSGADLSGADLSGADLSMAILSGADLRRAILTEANLEHATLEDAKVTEEQLAKCLSLEWATMPDGQPYEDWLKNKARGEEGENSSPS